MIRKCVLNQKAIENKEYTLIKALKAARSVKNSMEEKTGIGFEILRAYNINRVFLGYVVVDSRYSVNQEWDTL